MAEPNDNSPPKPPLTERSETSIRLGALATLGVLPEPPDVVLEPNLQDANELRLLLRGESVVDWFRLDFSTEEESRRLLALNAFETASGM